jgi:flagellar hook-associated protein 2
MSTTSLNLNSSTATTGAGIDVTSVVASILASESAPEDQAKASLAALGTQQTALSSLNVGLSALLSSIHALGDVTGAITARTATSSRTDLVTAAADSSAASGQHTIIVSNLATGSSYASAPIVGPIGSGSFQLQVGGAAAVPITVDNTNNTPAGLATYINAQNLGVTASVVTDANGVRLALLSNATGLPADLTISGDTTGLGFTKTATAVNASLTVDGVGISSASNTVTGVLGGVTLNLLNASPGAPIALSVASDSPGATQAVNSFVTAYNSLITSVNQQFTYNPASGTAGVLSGNGDLRGLQTQLLQEATYSVPGNNGITGLASIGVNLNNDGTLSVDSAKLADTLANHATDFQNFFQSASGQTGFAQKLSADLQNLTNPTQGLLNVAIAQNQNDQKSVQSSINNFEDRLVTRRQQLTTQYSQVDATLRAFPLLLAQINGELGSLPTASPLK